MFPIVKHWWVRPLFVLGICLTLAGLPMAGATAQAADSASGSLGFVALTDLQQSPSDPDSASAATARRNANLRQGPGTNYPIFGGVTAGQPLEIAAKNQAGDWLQLADGRWIFAALVEGAPAVEVSALPQPAAVEAAVQATNPAVSATANPVGNSWSLVAESAANFPGGRDRNHWYYLWTEGRGNFVWQDMQQTDGQGCYHDTAGKGLEICPETITANPKGDVGLQWKANRGGTYRFEWDSASLKFYKHGEFVGILDQGTQLPYATTVTDVIDWEMFFWVAADSTPYHVKVFRLEDSAAPAAQAIAAPQAPAAALSFGGGLHLVGSDIVPGTYRGVGGGYCYWERISALYDASRSIVANGIGYGPWIVTIAATDKAFDSQRCGVWTLDLSPITASPTAPFGGGMYFVGKDVAPGTWQSNGAASAIGNGCRASPAACATSRTTTSWPARRWLQSRQETRVSTATAAAPGRSCIERRINASSRWCWKLPDDDLAGTMRRRPERWRRMGSDG